MGLYLFIFHCMQKYFAKWVKRSGSTIQFICFISQRILRYSVVILLINNINVNIVGEHKWIMVNHVARLIGWFSTRFLKANTRLSIQNYCWRWTIQTNAYFSHNRLATQVSCYIVCTPYQEVIKCSWMSSISLLYLPLIRQYIKQ